MPISHIGALWPQVRPYLAAALARDEIGRYRPADVLDALLRGAVRLWVSWNEAESRVDAAVVTETIQYPQARELRIWLVGGRNMRAWAQEGLAMVEAFARAQGCAVVTGGLRRGWLRIGTGYRETGITMEKRL